METGKRRGRRHDTRPWNGESIVDGRREEREIEHWEGKEETEGEQVATGRFYSVASGDYGILNNIRGNTKFTVV